MYQVYNRGAFIFYPGFFQLVVFKGLPIPCGGGADSLFLLLFLQFVSLNLNFFFVFWFLVLLFHYFIEFVCHAYRTRYDHGTALLSPIDIVLPAYLPDNLYLSVAQLWYDITCISSTFEESARTLVVQDVDG